ncbi:major facilitator superfamily [Phialemonium atrogriseum]|uniref:Major facilitator superfamily n=1 Tax=Phialemonium atrogriseum TaxID=1093897 RepID=A0AAJ0BPP2_9PEZI|nr:major facilitator superfamily [Phialemonium atrogriseum]KAK1761905.1 major facilitator superfamily [Phialemonium atrogriseum]
MAPRDFEHGSPENAATGQPAQFLLSRLRCRNQNRNAGFTHPLIDLKSSPRALVSFDGPGDPYRPLNWSFKKKAMTTVLYGAITMGKFSPAIPQVGKQFHIGNEVGTLGISLFLFGVGLVYGRKMTVLAPYFLSTVFSFATAVSKDVQTIMITRFFSGFFGSAPITNVGGAAIIVYALTLVIGTVIAPLVGSAIVASYLGWRWTEYIAGILMLLSFTSGVIFLDESYAPVLLVYKARRLRIQSGNWSLHAQHEEWDASLKKLASKYLIRPFQLLATPICFFIVLYASFVYGLLYLSLALFPKFYTKRYRANNAPAVSMGLGFFTIFQAALNYLIDTFQEYAASAVAVNTFLRSVFAGGFPLFTNAMFYNLGVPWAQSLLGFFACALIPVPYVFYTFGPRIRARGKWSRASVN